MSKNEAAELARACREQAQLASTSEARKTLIELAQRYENEGLESSVDRSRERAGEELE